MNDKRSLEVFENAPVWQAVIKNALPAIAAMIMVLIYNLADTFFIGQTHDDMQVAAVSLATPVFMLFMSLGTIFGIGGTSVISRALGEGRSGYAKKVSSFCMWGSTITGIAVSACFLLFMDHILSWTGASAGTWEYEKTYMTIVCFAGPFSVLNSCFSNIIRAEGQSGKAMVGQMAGNLLNVILDPVMILGFGWDIAGAAVATVIGNVVGTLYYMVYFLRGKSMLSILPSDLTVRNGVASGVLKIGIPAALGSFLMSISGIVMNTQMTKYGDMAVAGAGVAMKVTMITGMVCIGLGQGVQPLLGYCVGAGKKERYSSVLRFSLVFALILSIIMTAAGYAFTGKIVRAFLTDRDAYEYGVSFARILLTTSFLFGVYYVLMNALQACGAAKESLIVNLSRQGIIYIPVLFILGALFDETGLIWAQPVADVVSLVLTIVLYRRRGSQMYMDHGYESRTSADACC